MKWFNKSRIKMTTLTLIQTSHKTTKNSFTNSITCSKNNLSINRCNLRMRCRIKLLDHLELKGIFRHKTMQRCMILGHSNSFHNLTLTIFMFWKSSCKIYKWKWVNSRTKNIVWVKKRCRWKIKLKRLSNIIKLSFIRLHQLKLLQHKLLQLMDLALVQYLLLEASAKRIQWALMIIHNNSSSTIQHIQTSQMPKAQFNQMPTKATSVKFILCTRNSS
jgi:hypothetical protein